MHARKKGDASTVKDAAPTAKQRVRQRLEDRKPTLNSKQVLNGLTSKQERTAQLFVGGLSKTDAYSKVYNVGADTKRQTIQRAATKLFQNPKVVARVEQLQKQQVENSTQNNVPSQDEVLAKIISIAEDEDEKTTDRLRALALLSKITGLDKVTDAQDLEPASVDDAQEKLAAKLGAMLSRIEADE